MGSQKGAALFEVGTWILRFPGIWMGRDRLELREEMQGELPKGHPVRSVPTHGKGLGLGHVWHLKLICCQ